jgi:integrase
LSTFFRYAIRQHRTRINPIAEVDIPSDADAVRMHVLTPVEEQHYFRLAARLPNLHDVGRLMLNQGMRPEEVTVLAKEDVDLGRGVIHVRMGKSLASKRMLDMTSESRKILERRMKGGSPWIFPSTRKPGSHIGRINSAHDSIVREAGKAGISIKFVPYDFQHTFATLAAEEGISLPTLAALLGHGSLRVLHKYVHPSAENKRAAMARYDKALKKAGKRAKGAR